MKATHHFRNSGEACTQMRITFTVTKQHIIYVVADLKASDRTITRKTVTDGVRDLLKTDGDIHFAYRDINTYFGVDCLESRATTTAKRLFPDFFKVMHKVK